ncbi:MAG TPA: 30S ribosomal protein S8 [Kofleriaceae bacterium]|nr:30S ribosomal protein S8 [Kofleriaceae bacterium]
MTDPIADFLARIRNGIRARKQAVECPRSNIKLRIAEILRDEGFVQAVSTAEDKKQGVMKLELRYDGRPSESGCAITGMRRVSRPGQRHYVPAKQVPKVRNGLGIAIISTSQGVMTDREARHKGVGGEVLCEVW